MSRDWTQQEFGITGKEPDAYEQLKSELAKVKKQLAIAVEALERYATGTDKTKESDEEGNEYEFEYPLTNDDGETAKEALKQIKELDK